MLHFISPISFANGVRHLFFQTSRESDFYPVHLPDDVPVDFLEGSMDLKVVLPTQKIVRMAVERKLVITYIYDVIKPCLNRFTSFMPIS